MTVKKTVENAVQAKKEIEELVNKAIHMMTSIFLHMIKREPATSRMR